MAFLVFLPGAARAVFFSSYFRHARLDAGPSDERLLHGNSFNKPGLVFQLAVPEFGNSECLKLADQPPRLLDLSTLGQDDGILRPHRDNVIHQPVFLDDGKQQGFNDPLRLPRVA